MESKLSLRDASIARMRALTFGDPVTNVCAGENNPSLHAFFVAYEIKSHKNRYGLVHRSHWAKCTDRKGKFWNADIDVVYPGHLDATTRSELFDPVWQALFGTKDAAKSDDEYSKVEESNSRNDNGSQR